VSDATGERQFEASAARLRKAREDGDLPRSPDLCGAISFAAGVIALSSALPLIVTSSQNVLRMAALQRRTDLALLGWLFASTALLPMAASACAALLAGFLQTGGLQLHFPPVSFKKMNPLEGLRRMFSRDAILAVARGGLAVGCMGAMLAPLVYRVLAQSVRSESAWTLGSVAWNGALCVGFVGVIFAAVFGTLDYIIARIRWRKRLRMTLEEFKRDQKESEGDPLVRSRRRSLQRRYSRLALRHVADAAFVVANPTHLAIALEYRPPEVPVPRVLLKTCDHAALRLRVEAKQRSVPIVEDPVVARALYATTSVGEPIPLELYIAVAAIVVALAQRRGA